MVPPESADDWVENRKWLIESIKEIKQDISLMKQDIAAMREKDITQDWQIKNVSGRVAFIVSILTAALMKVVFKVAGV